MYIFPEYDPYRDETCWRYCVSSFKNTNSLVVHLVGIYEIQYIIFTLFVYYL